VCGRLVRGDTNPNLSVRAQIPLTGFPFFRIEHPNTTAMHSSWCPAPRLAGSRTRGSCLPNKRAPGACPMSTSCSCRDPRRRFPVGASSGTGDVAQAINASAPMGARRTRFRIFMGPWVGSAVPLAFSRAVGCRRARRHYAARGVPAHPTVDAATKCAKVPLPDRVVRREMRATRMSLETSLAQCDVTLREERRRPSSAPCAVSITRRPP